VIKIQGQGDNRGKEFTATLGCYIVELKGSFRVYKPQQFESSFDVIAKSDEESDSIPEYELQNDGITAVSVS